MKYIYKLLLILFVFGKIQAQTQIVDITDEHLNGSNDLPYGYYFKDLYHVLDPYVGTWVFTDGTTQ